MSGSGVCLHLPLLLPSIVAIVGIVVIVIVVIVVIVIVVIVIVVIDIVIVNFIGRFGDPRHLASLPRPLPSLLRPSVAFCEGTCRV